MTRERFVKLLMAKGCSRNSAQEMAIYVRTEGRSYADAYRAIEAFASLSDITAALSETITNAAEAITRVIKAIAAGAAAFSTAYQSAMLEEE